MWRLLISLLSVSAVFANDKDWWKYTEIYEVFIASFQDSNGDGIGDLKGMKKKKVKNSFIVGSTDTFLHWR